MSKIYEFGAKPEQSPPKPDEPVRPKQNKAVQGKAGPGRAEQGRAGQGDKKTAPPQPGKPFGQLTFVGKSGALLELSRGEKNYAFKLQPGDFIGVGHPGQAFILQIRRLNLSENRVDGTADTANGYCIEGQIVGRLSQGAATVPVFYAGSTAMPPLQSKSFLLTAAELAEIISPLSQSDSTTLCLGNEIRTGKELQVDLNQLLERHIAVLGSSGSGKSCFAAAVLQQLVELEGSRIIVFDVNGEYDEAFAHCPPGMVQSICLGTAPGAGDDPLAEDSDDMGEGNPSDTRYLRIPYYSLGRSGLMRLLQPEEKAQRPALDFALDHLHYIEWDFDEAGAMPVGASEATLFDDCRQTNANETHIAIDELRYGLKRTGSQWPHMLALSALMADSYCLTIGRSGWSRSNELYGHVSPLVNRIHRLVEDPRFRAIINVEGGLDYSDERMDLQRSGRFLVDDIFGDADGSGDWRIKIINLKAVPHDLLPLILDAMLGQLSQVLFHRGTGQTYPTLLVLEEAHHYLMHDRSGQASDALLAYERLAKEGRKFGLSLWLSTQRPSEISPTVLSQCGNWAVFRLISDIDIQQVQAASEWIDAETAGLISTLSQRELLFFGSAVPIPMRLRAYEADPLPASQSPEFVRRWTGADT